MVKVYEPFEKKMNSTPMKEKILAVQWRQTEEGESERDKKGTKHRQKTEKNTFFFFKRKRCCVKSIGQIVNK